MAFHEPLVALLKADERVFAITTRITPVDAAQRSSLPYIVYRVSVHEEVHAHDGPGGLLFGVFLVTCWADDYGEAWTLALAVKPVLNGLPKGTYSEMQFEGVFFQRMNDTPDPAIDGGSSSTKGVQLSFLVQYKES